MRRIINEDIKKKANMAISELTKKEQWIDKYWNKDRLLSIVSIGMNLRYKQARKMYKEALLNQNFEEIIEMAAMLVRGFDALVKNAEELGHTQLSVNVWPHEYKSKRYLVVKHDQEFILAYNAYADEPETVVITLDELFKIADEKLLDIKKMIQTTAGQPGKIKEYKKND